MQSLGATVGVVGGGVGVVTEGVRAGIAGLMSLAATGASLPSEGGGVFCMTFNQDYTSLGVGTRIGYRLFSLTTLDKLELICDNGNEDTCIVERLFSSSLVAVVSLSSPRKLKVCHFKKNSEICNYSYPNTILGVKLNRARLVVCLEESLYIHNIRDMKVLHTIRDTPPNPTGLCALSISNENCFLAYPGSNSIGQVQIFDAQNLQAKIMIPAHDSPLAAISFNASGTKIATASEKGTVIRVFSVAEGARLHELRRGMKRCATIFSLAFSPDSLFLCASSNTETVHVFRLEEIKETRPPVVEEQQGLMGWMSKAVSASASYLPTPVADMMSQGRAFATVTLPFQGVRNVCAIATIQKQTRVLVASMDGYLYVYNLNTSEGGDCALIKQHRLDGTEGGVTTGEGTAAAATAPGPYPGGAKKTEPVSSGGGGEGSYAGVVRGPAVTVMTEADKMSEMAAACESPPKSVLKFDDDNEFPPPPSLHLFLVLFSFFPSFIFSSLVFFFSFSILLFLFPSFSLYFFYLSFILCYFVLFIFLVFPLFLSFFPPFSFFYLLFSFFPSFLPSFLPYFFCNFPPSFLSFLLFILYPFIPSFLPFPLPSFLSLSLSLPFPSEEILVSFHILISVEEGKEGGRKKGGGGRGGGGGGEEFNVFFALM